MTPMWLVKSPIWNINLATNANFVPPWVAATFRNRNSDGWWQRRSAANDGLKSKSLRGWPCLTRKCSNIFSSTKLSSLNRCEFVPVTFSWLRQRGSAPDVAEAKDRQMLDIAARLGQGEDFSEL